GRRYCARWTARGSADARVWSNGFPEGGNRRRMNRIIVSKKGGRMSAMGRPERAYRSAQREGTPMTVRRHLRIAPLAAACLCASALAAPFAYVSNEGSATVSVIDVATDKVTTSFKVGTKPRGIALAPDGKNLYISDQSSNSLLTIDTATGSVASRTPLGESPEAV